MAKKLKKKSLVGWMPYNWSIRKDTAIIKKKDIPAYSFIKRKTVKVRIAISEIK